MTSLWITLLGASLPIADRDRTITLEIAAGTVPVILAKINEKLGTRLTSDSIYNNDAFMLRAKDRRLGDLLDAFAIPLEAKWSPAGRLVPDHSARARREREITANQRISLKNRVAAAEELMQKYGVFTAASLAERSRGITPDPRTGRNVLPSVGESPAHLIGAEIAPLLPIEALAKLRPGGSLAFASSKDGTETRMPSNMETALRRALSELAKVDIYDRSAPVSGYTAMLAESLKQGKPHRIRLTVRCAQFEPIPDFSLHLEIWTEQGEPLLTARLTLPAEEPGRGLKNPDFPPPHSGSPALHAPVKIDPIGQRLGLFGDRLRGAVRLPEQFVAPWDHKKDAELLARVLNPLDHDPHELTLGAPLLESARRYEIEALIPLRDQETWVEVADEMGNGPTPGIFLRGGFAYARPREKNGFWYSTLPLGVAQIDRGALQRALRRAQSEGTLTWKNLMQYATEERRRGELSTKVLVLESAYFDIVTRVLNHSEDELGKRPALKWLASWPPVLMQELEAGKPVLVHRLPKPHQQALWEILDRRLFRLSNLGAARRAAMAPGGQSKMHLMGIEVPGPVPNPLTLLPDGIPREAEVTLARSRVPLLLAENEQGFFVWREEPTFAHAMPTATRPDWSVARSWGFVGLKNFRRGELERVFLEVQFNADFSLRIPFQFPIVDFSAPPLKVDALPLGVREALARQEYESPRGAAERG